MRNKRKLNTIKYSKIIKERLNIYKKDFEVYLYIKEFNNTYKVNIEDIDIKKLNLSNLYIRNDALTLLSTIEFKNI